MASPPVDGRPLELPHEVSGLARLNGTDYISSYGGYEEETGIQIVNHYRKLGLNPSESKGPGLKTNLKFLNLGSVYCYHSKCPFLA